MLITTVGGDGVLVHNAKVTHFNNFDLARKDAFKQAGMTNPTKIKFKKYDSVTGTVVEKDLVVQK